MSKSTRAFSKTNTLILCLAKISEASIICYLMPFITSMVTSFHVKPSTASRYSGLIEAALIITEAIFSPLWGGLSDRFGRKAFFVFGLFAFAIASIALGLSQSLIQAIIARCISDVLGAVAVLVRMMQFEIAEAEEIDRVIEWLAPTWAIGASFGPLIGGALAEPAKTMPSIFGGTIFETYPYLLPSIVVAFLPAVTAILAFIWLPETRNDDAESAGNDDNNGPNEWTPLSNSSSRTDITLVAEEPSTYDARKLLFALGCSAALSFVSMSYCSAFMMMASTALKHGGLGLAPWQIGIMLAVSSVLGVLVGRYGTVYLNRRYGWYRSLRIASFFHVLLFPLIAFAGFVARLEGGFGVCTGIVVLCVLVCYEIGETSFSGVDVVISDRAPQGSLGKISGISACLSSLGRVLAPIAAGQLWAFGIETTLPGGKYLIWCIFTLMALGWHVLTRRLSQPDHLKWALFKNEEAVANYGTFSSRTAIDTLVDGYSSSELDTDDDE